MENNNNEREETEGINVDHIPGHSIFWQNITPTVSIKEIKERRAPRKRIISLSPEGPSRGRVLFSYQNEGFLLDPGTPFLNTHTRFWQSLKMAETFVELGYEVDVIHWTNQSFVPKGNYSFLVDVRHNLERLSPILNKDCVKIMHLINFFF